jgi:hypothetical protein
VGYLDANLHPHHQGVGKHGAELDQQTAVATAWAGPMLKPKQGSVFSNYNRPIPYCHTYRIQLATYIKQHHNQSTYVNELHIALRVVGVERAPVVLNTNSKRKSLKKPISNLARPDWIVEAMVSNRIRVSSLSVETLFRQLHLPSLLGRPFRGHSETWTCVQLLNPKRNNVNVEVYSLL